MVDGVDYNVDEEEDKPSADDLMVSRATKNTSAQVAADLCNLLMKICCHMNLCIEGLSILPRKS